MKFIFNFATQLQHKMKSQLFTSLVSVVVVVNEGK